MNAVRVVRGEFQPNSADQAEAQERRRAAREILARPLLRAQADPTAFHLVKRHAEELRRWFSLNTGWVMTVDTEVIRLSKTTPPATETARAIASHHPARLKPSDPPFTRRRYVLACLALAALERSENQATLGRLAEQVVNLAGQRELDGIEFTFATREERSDLAAAIRLLLQLGVLRRVAGDEDSFVQSRGDALYDVERRVLARILATQHGPSMIAAAWDGARPPIDAIERELHARPEAFTDEEANRMIRQRLTAALLEDPVLYADELDQPTRAYLNRQRGAITGRIAELTGLVPEIRAEGIAMTDPEDWLTDVKMPEVGTEGHATLLMAEHLAHRGAAGLAELRGLTRRWAERFARYWRRSAREAGGDGALVSAAVDKLEALGLARRDGQDVRPLPAIGRFKLKPVSLAGQSGPGRARTPAPHPDEDTLL
ncbi:MAG: TIGR02678 family protein [Bifidobacteriaceae bacterium]|nr:TIGR02678 family protein [Bifidobacteriaceae bacterium]